MKYYYRDQDLYGEPGYQGRGGGQSGGQTYSLYPGSQGLSVDLPSPDSGLGSDQVSYSSSTCLTFPDIFMKLLNASDIMCPHLSSISV